MLPLLLPGETLTGFLRRPGLYLRLRYRLRLLLWTLQGTQEEPEWYLLKWLVDPDRAAIDIGANYGTYSGRLAALTRRVHCFEPFPEAAARLALKLPPSVVVHQAAVSDQAGRTLLAIPLREDGTPAVQGASVAADNLELRNRPVRTIPCDLVRLDDAVSEPVGFIKIDVEGHELAVLQGARRILEHDRPLLLIESARVLNSEAPDHVFRLLGEHGYEGVFLFGGRMTSIRAFDPAAHQRLRPDGGVADPYVWNFIFLPAR
jgi:FkbM family methyltransferase